MTNSTFSLFCENPISRRAESACEGLRKLPSKRVIKSILAYSKALEVQNGEQHKVLSVLN